MQTFFKILLAMLMILNSISVNPIDEQSLLDTLPPECEAVADFIEENFALFVEKYNEEIEDSDANWSATGIESRMPIFVLSPDGLEDALFLDFSAEDGYAVLGDNYVMYDFQTEGESPLKDIEADAFAYNVYGGYLYMVDGNYYSIEEQNNSIESYWDSLIMNQQQYDGQEKDQTGCGKIKDTDKYIKSKYGSGWKLNKSGSLPMTGFDQWDLSVYKNNRKDGAISEGNCWVVSAYTVLQYYADEKYSSKMPISSDIVDYDPKTSEPRIYKLYYNKAGNNISGTVTRDGIKYFKYQMKNESYKFNKLWAKTREYVDEKYGKINGGTIWETENIIKNVAKDYDVTINTNVSVLWGYTYNNVISSIDRGDAFIWSTSNDTYGSHTMAGCGYKQYIKETKIWFVTHSEYKLFYELRDGHSKEARYYDVNGHVGFSAIIFLEAV